MNYCKTRTAYVFTLGKSDPSCNGSSQDGFAAAEDSTKTKDVIRFKQTAD